MEARSYATAIPLFLALREARGDGDESGLSLAIAWQAAAQKEPALAAYDAFIAETTDAKLKNEALKRRARLRNRRLLFGSNQRFRTRSLPKLAKKSFVQGRKAFKKKQYPEALLYFRMGAALAPDAAGFLRELGATYDKLGAKKEKVSYFIRYLRNRPFGKNSKRVRKQMKSDKAALGTVTITTPFSCELFIVSGVLGPKLPIKKLTMAPGRYEYLCINTKYRIGYDDDFVVTAGEHTDEKLSWAIIENELVKPYGRIAFENRDVPGQMMDLGISQKEIGVKAPTNGTRPQDAAQSPRRQQDGRAIPQD